MSRCSRRFAEGLLQIHDEDPPSSDCTNALHVSIHFLPVRVQPWALKHSEILRELYSLSQHQPASSILSLAFQPIIELAATFRRRCSGPLTHDT